MQMAKHSPTIKNRPGMGRFAFFSGLRSLTTSNRRPLRSPVQDARMLLALVAILAALLLASCAPSTPAETPAPAVDPTQTFQAALAQAASAIPTQTPLPTATVPPPTLTPTATPLRTPPPLPPVFTSDILDADAVPQTYIEDTCEYLKARWDPNKSAPGTVVMILMYHSVTEDGNPLIDESQVHHSELIKTLEHAYEVGFETITAEQLAGFLEHNERIPRRSLLLIVDDRKRKEYYETHFIPHLREYGWQITNAWISAKDTPEYLWKENEEVVAEGWVDVQAHGVVHNMPISELSTEEYIRGELGGSIEAIEAHFGKRPVGFIWPGGGFTKRAVELAREYGYRVGFTTNPRGPVMYNWIPQAEAVNPNRPSWLPEIPAGDPLMTLPRYWSMDAAYRIDDVINIGDQAAAEAEKNKAVELEYYDVVCKSRTGEIPQPAP